MPKSGKAKFGKYEFGNAVQTNDEYEWDLYQETPIMSTYILGIAVANDFKYSEIKRKTRKDRRNIRAWVEQSATVHDSDTSEELGWKNITERNVNYT